MMVAAMIAVGKRLHEDAISINLTVLCRRILRLSDARCVCAFLFFFSIDVIIMLIIAGFFRWSRISVITIFAI